MLLLKNKKKNLYIFSNSKREEPGHPNDHPKANLNFANINNSVSDIWHSLMIFWVRKGLGSSVVLPFTAHTSYLGYSNWLKSTSTSVFGSYLIVLEFQICWSLPCTRGWIVTIGLLALIMSNPNFFLIITPVLQLLCHQN